MSLQPRKAVVKPIQKQLSKLLALSTKEWRKYGLGHLFIDQSLNGISKNLEIQTFILGYTGNIRDVDLLESQFGKKVANSVQRTLPESKGNQPTWVIYGVAAPVKDIAWEITSIKKEDLTTIK